MKDRAIENLSLSDKIYVSKRGFDTVFTVTKKENVNHYTYDILDYDSIFLMILAIILTATANSILQQF